MYKIGKAINVSTKPNFEKIINYNLQKNGLPNVLVPKTAGKGSDYKV